MPPDSGLGERAASAAKWSVVAQVVSKLISPLTTMVLARLLAPEAFGVIATASMVTSLADMFSDAGFQKYLIQHRFSSKEGLYLAANVAFWTNLAISVFAVAAIAMFCDPLAAAVGSPGMGPVLAVAALSLPLTAMVSVQTALYQRELDFRTLFGSRVGSSLLIFAVAVPLAALGFGYWSMVGATVASNAFLAAWLTVKSPWRPRLSYSPAVLRRMFSFGVWILLESFATWLNTWAGTFVIGAVLDAHSVGLYKTSTSVCSSVVGVFTASLIPVVFSALSSVQSDEGAFERVFFKMQRYLAMCLVPVAAGVFVYRRAFTLIFLGDQWLETSLFLGLWMLSGCLVVVFGYTCSEAYRARGMPRLCVLVQVLYLVPFLPALYLSARQGYGAVSVVMPATRLLLGIINVAVMRAAIGYSPLRMLRNAGWSFLQAAVAMVPGVVVTALTDSFAATLASAVMSVLAYVALLFGMQATRGEAVGLLERLGVGRFLSKRLHKR